MDAAVLKRYKFFGRLGMFGIERDSVRGARSLLKVGGAILSHKDSMLWITPQGYFADPRIRPVRFRPGLGHLVTRTAHCAVLPIALEYPFWEERFPEALARCGQVILRDNEVATDAGQWTALLEQRLESLQDSLAADGILRNRGAFETLLSGRAGVGGSYDLWRRVKARLHGEAFRAEHGEQQP